MVGKMPKVVLDRLTMVKARVYKWADNLRFPFKYCQQTTDGSQGDFYAPHFLMVRLVTRITPGQSSFSPFTAHHVELQSSPFRGFSLTEPNSSQSQMTFARSRTYDRGGLTMLSSRTPVMRAADPRCTTSAQRDP